MANNSAGNNDKDYRISITFRCPISLAKWLDNAQKEFRKKDRTEMIIEMLIMSKFILENKEAIKEPADIQYLRQNMYSTQLVDWVAEMPQDRLEIIYAILADEKRIRLNAKYRHSTV